MAIGTQIGFALSGFMPTLAAAVAGEGTGGWLPVALLVLACCAVSAAATLGMRETFRTPMALLGVRTPKDESARIPA
jgi:hypothetical protein